MSENSPTPKNSMCLYRWHYPLVNLSTGEVKTCCHTVGEVPSQSEMDSLGPDVFLNHPTQLQYRSEMLKGEKNPACNHCWRMEEKGVTSPRQGAEWIANYFNRHGIAQGNFNQVLTQLQANPSSVKSSHPELLEIMLGPACDLKCMYCNEVFSSLWEQEKKKFNDPIQHVSSASKPTSFDENFWKWFESIHKSLYYISFIGGEPLINPRFHETVSRICSIFPQEKRDFPTLGVISNFNAPEPVFDRFLSTVEKATKQFPMIILASVDTVGPRAEYIRHGLKWDRLIKNVKKLLAKRPDRVSFTFNPTLNVLSIPTMIELLKLAVELRNEFDFPIALGRSMVISPSIFSPLILPRHYSHHLDECIDFVTKHNDPKYKSPYHGDWDLFIGFLQGVRDAIRDGQPNPVEHVNFMKQVLRNDVRRGTSIKSIFPEYVDFFSHCESLLEPKREAEVHL